MYYETISKRIGQDAKGNDKEFSEKFIVDNCVICSEAEQKTLEFWNGENEVVSVKQSKIREFVNVKSKEEGQDIYVATVADVFVDDNGKEKEIKYVVAIWATSVGEANELVGEYLKQGMEDFRIIGVKRTKFVDLI